MSGLTPSARALLAEGAAILQVPLDNAQLQVFERYAVLLATWSQKFNLTAVREPEAVVRVHFLESLACLRGAEIKAGSLVIDIGSGAGFPGIPMKIARPDLKMTLLEASRRRAAFLELASSDLQIDLDVIHGRAETVGHLPERRERFDAVVSRATAPLPRLVELCLPYLKIGGIGIFPKGGNTGVELANAASLVRELGGGMTRSLPIEGPWNRSRRRVLVIIAKTSTTPERYPRARV